jgi:hypothetical protein
VAVAIHTGVAPDVWIDNPRQMFTALDLIEEMNEQARRHA